MDEAPFPREVVDLFRLVEADLPALRRLRPRLNEMLGRHKDLGLDEELANYFLLAHPDMTRSDIMLSVTADILEVAQVTPLIAATTVDYQPATCLTAIRPAALPGSSIQRRLPSIDGYVSKVEGFEISFKFDMPVCFRRAAEDHSIIVPLSSPGHDAIYVRGGRSGLGEADVVLAKVGIIYDHFVGNNYCHWLLDWLPRLHLIQQIGVRLSDLSFVFPRLLEPFQRQMLAALAVRPDQIVEVADYGQHPHSVVAFQNFAATSTLRRSYTHALHGGSPWAANLLRLSLAAGPMSDAGPLRLIINRRASRRLIFSDAAASLLERTGFTVVYLEDFSFQEQISLFRRVERVIGAHGAGLANLVFCKETAHVLEIFPPDYSTSAYRMISLAVGFNYACAVGETVTVNDVRHLRDHDILCSTQIVTDWLCTSM